MIKTVLIWVLVIFVIGLIIFWFWGGGFAAAARTVKTMVNPIDLFWGNASGTPIRLPWQPASMTRGPDISDYATEADRYQQGMSPDDTSPPQTDAKAEQLKSFGTPSPYAGEISIVDNTATESDPAREYIVVEHSGNAGGPVAITGWSVQSAVSGLRAYIGQGSAVFLQGVVNATEPLSLSPSESAIVTTGISPVGASFRENICSGYLGELQTFVPEIPASCPFPSDALPETADNLRTYGGACFDYLKGLPVCHFPPTVPADLSANCRSFIGNSMTYNGCVNMYKNRSDFTLPQWRIYLGMRAGLWYDTHDVLRLLDDQGRTVDVLTY